MVSSDEVRDLLLRSAEELGEYPVTVVHSLREWAGIAPEHPLISERDRGDWRTVSYRRAGEITDKGYINQRRVLACRSGLVDMLYTDPVPTGVIVAEGTS